MLTPQEVAEHGFSKARVGGYSMKEVDDFLDQLTEDYSTLHKENAVLRGKINSLAKKINEYRETEDAMRTTLLSAQHQARAMVEEAEQEKQRLLDAAEDDVAQRKAELEHQVTEQENRLALAKANARDFIEQMKELVRHESAFLDQLPPVDEPEPQEEPEADGAPEPQADGTDAPESAEAEEEPEPAEPAESDAAEPASEAEPAPQAGAAPDAQAAPAPEAPEEPDAQAAPEEDPVQQISETVAAGDVLASVSADAAGVLDVEELAVGRIDFNNLKFGKDYEIK
jgi:cell division initiation protein